MKDNKEDEFFKKWSSSNTNGNKENENNPFIKEWISSKTRFTPKDYLLGAPILKDGNWEIKAWGNKDFGFFAQKSADFLIGIDPDTNPIAIMSFASYLRFCFILESFGLDPTDEAGLITLFNIEKLVVKEGSSFPPPIELVENKLKTLLSNLNENFLSDLDNTGKEPFIISGKSLELDKFHEWCESQILSGVNPLKDVAKLRELFPLLKFEENLQKPIGDSKKPTYH